MFGTICSSRYFLIIATWVVSTSLSCLPTHAAGWGACGFDYAALRFAGNAVEQARCLLQPTRYGAAVGKGPPPALPKFLEERVEKPIDQGILRAQLDKFLARLKVAQADVGGPLSDPLVSSEMGNGKTQLALYFVIHDTATPALKQLPGDIDKPTWKYNQVESEDIYTNWWKSINVMISRIGTSRTFTQFSESRENYVWEGATMGHATRLEREDEFSGRATVSAVRNTFLHVENVQPRLFHSDCQNVNYACEGPATAFTNAQYERLALVYLSASVRRGSWLIPARHANIVRGVKSKDDPRGFDVGKWVATLEALLDEPEFR